MKLPRSSMSTLRSNDAYAVFASYSLLKRILIFLFRNFTRCELTSFEDFQRFNGDKVRVSFYAI